MQNSFFSQQVLNKVPAATLLFWLIKVLSTTVGETAADYLAVDLNFGLGVTSLVMFAVLAVVLVYQLLKAQYIPWVYWLSVILVSVSGTLITDNLVDNYGVSLELTTTVFALALIATFSIWQIIEGTLSISAINTRKRELFYWLAILLTFALGTAFGDLIAEGLNLGYGTSLLIFAGVIVVIAMTHYVFKLNAITSFWLAYIFTRPLGASLGDWLSQSTHDGGLGIGAMLTSVLFFSAILGAIALLTRQNRLSVA